MLTCTCTYMSNVNRCYHCILLSKSLLFITLFAVVSNVLNEYVIASICRHQWWNQALPNCIMIHSWFFLKIYSSISTHLWCFSQFLSFWKDFSCPTQISNWLSCHFKTDIKCFYIDVWLFVILSYTFNIFKPLILISLAYKIMETIQKQYIIWT